MKRPLRNRTMGVVRGGLAPAYSILTKSAEFLLREQEDG